jgi:hypothetical protein
MSFCVFAQVSLLPAGIQSTLMINLSLQLVCIADEPGIKYMPDPYDAAAELAAEKRWHV